MSYFFYCRKQQNEVKEVTLEIRDYTHDILELFYN